MSIWLKITVYSVIVFMIIFNVSAVTIIEENHSNMLQQEVENTLSQSNTIYKGITAMNPVYKIYNNSEYTSELIKVYAETLVYGTGKNMSYVEIINDSGKMIYINIDFVVPDDRIELEDIKNDEFNYILRKIDQRIYIFSAFSIPIGVETYNISYIRDLTYLYENRLDEYQFFIVLDILAFLIYIISMFFVSKSITRPIEKMVHSTKVITSGRYNERVNIQTNDEMEKLANNFNEMATAIEIKINELARSNEEKQSFINDFTHELRTPLTSILGYADFLRKSPYNEELFIEALDTVYSEGKRLEIISVKLMNLVLLEKENLPLRLGNLKEVILDITSVLEINARDNQVHLVFLCDECEFFMDSDLMKSLVINLVENAIKASKEGKKVIISCFSLGDERILSVQDEGQGICAKHLDKITQPFYRVDEVRTTKNNGIGLGLSICKKIIHLHQGEFFIESELDQGTTITIKFPKFRGDR